jgi:hypothetical protein
LCYTVSGIDELGGRLARETYMHPDELKAKTGQPELSKATANPFLQSWRGRSKAWWIGAVAGLIVLVVGLTAVEIAFNVTFYGGGLGMLGAFAGGALGDLIALRARRFHEDLMSDGRRRGAQWRRTLLVIGVLVFVVNVLPQYRENFASSGGGYY